MKNIQGLHPFMFASFFILEIYAYQPDLVDPLEVVPPLLAVLLIIAVLFSALAWSTGPAKAAMISTTGVIFTLAFYTGVTIVSGFLEWIGPPDSLAGERVDAFLLILFLFWVTLPLVITVVILRSSADWLGINTILNAVAGILVLGALVRIVSAEIQMRPREETYPLDAALQASIVSDDSDNQDLGLPSKDIYYIIFDRYASARTLDDVYGFDNSAMLNFLDDQGFYVAGESHANYLKTAQSLSSSLNMEHIDYLKEIYGDGPADRHPLTRRVRDHQVLRYVHSHGYRFLQLGSGWEPTRTNPYADRTYNSYLLSEFSRTVLRSSFLPHVSERLGVRVLNASQSRCDHVSSQFERLLEVTEEPGPKFVFAHFLLPHPPFVFDRDGRCLTFDEILYRDNHTGYLAQIEFTNVLIEEFINHLHLGDENDPIVVIQADEGPYPNGFADVEDWTQMMPEDVRQKMRILNAYYLPGVDTNGVLYPSITPVNTFRIVFNEYFGENYEVLEDRAYAHVNERRRYSFFDVTEIVRFTEESTR